MNTLPEKQLLKRGEVMRGLELTRGQFEKYESAGKLRAVRLTPRSKKLYKRCVVVKLQQELED